MKRIKLCIRSKLVLIVLAIVVPLLIVTCFGYIMMFQSNRNELSWKIRLVAEEIARELGEHFDKTFNVIDVLATNPSVIKMDPVACDRLFSKLLPSYPLHLNILAARSDGFNVGSAVSPQDAHALNYNDKEWFQQSISGKRVIGNLHVSKLFKSPAIMMASPVYDSNASVRGVIGFPMSLDKLREKIVRDWQLPPKSIVVVADAKGNILVDTLHKDHVGKNFSHMPILKNSMTASSNFIKMNVYDGIERLFYVSTPHGTNWRILVGIPSGSFIESASAINSPYLIAIILTAIIGVSISIAIGGRLSNNIALIAEGLKTIGSGKLEYHLSLKGHDELADIAGYFNEMVEKHQQYEQEIKGMNAQLERRVEERTAQLVAANNELDSFSYSVSHDLRAPLRAIDGFSTMLINGHGQKLDEEGVNLLVRIRSACIRMNKLIDDLLELSHVVRADFHKKSVNLSEMAISVAEDLRGASPDRKIELQISPNIIANVDPVLMRTVMENLLGNAWKFTRNIEKPVVIFGATKESGTTTYFVKDNGAGFNQAYVGKLFNAFQRLHTSQEFEGSGVGLASVRKIINRHGGEIWAEGKENEGATFYFTLESNAPTIV